jgi:filamentous hemagglutinin family protein
MNSVLNSSVSALVVGSALLGLALPGQATPITPAPNGTTQVEASGATFTITGGNLSADQQTLFHAFTEFGLTADQTAAFLAQPNVQSILGAITGGQASYIDGRLQVTGSAANLYLINPAGILFGPNAQLDLAGSFAATTASGVLFDAALFNVLGANDYSQLTGAPTGFAFTGEEGAIVNAADLAVMPGESITLVGGQVISTGTLTAPGGDITIAAIPDSNLVRISQADRVLSLELESYRQRLRLPYRLSRWLYPNC